jgi:hypothetical protein
MILPVRSYREPLRFTTPVGPRSAQG